MIGALSRRLRRARSGTDAGWVPLRRRGPGLRRWLSAGLVAAAIGAALTVLAPDPAPGRPVLVATRDVPAGAALQAADLRASTLSPSAVAPAALPDAVVSDPALAVGRVLAAPLSAGEVLTTARLVGPGLLTGRPPGDVIAPVRIADAGVVALLRPGARVDVVLASEQEPAAHTVTQGATVLAVPGSAEGGGLLGGPASGGAGGLLLLAVPSSAAVDLAGAAAHGALSVVLR